MIDLYVYPHTTTLKNIANIQDEKKQQEISRAIWRSYGGLIHIVMVMSVSKIIM